ncbi:MAG: flagellar hook-basal body protein [Lachnospiraceae bacterium]|nr:flagellar hook-basal body protein [Lachnospiraceae bacterium]
MMRSLWSAASGMISQQTAVDTIANNLANVNTTGYKNEKTEFKSLLYQTLQTRTTTANGEEKPISAQVGLGTRVAAITSNFTQGPHLDSESYTAMAIDGDGFFAVRGADGNTYYTRNGDFKLSVGEDGNLTLVTADGFPVLDTNGNPIVFPGGIQASKMMVSQEGALGYLDGQNNYVALNQSIGLFQFNNPAGLDKLSNSLLGVTDASGEAMNEATTPNLVLSTVRQGYLEGSNVQVADEMVNLIVAQRAYEMNSKAIQASDDMLGQANQLKR